MTISHGDSYANGGLTPNSYGSASAAGFAGLSKAEQQAIRSYTSNGYVDINNAFRAGAPTEKGEMAAKAVREAAVPLKTGTVLSRKVKMTSKELVQLTKHAEGTVIQEFGLSSTSIKTTTWGGNVHLRMAAGEGVRGLYVGGGVDGHSPISALPFEHEVILPANTRMIVTKVTTHDKVPKADQKDGWDGPGVTLVDVVILPTT